MVGKIPMACAVIFGTAMISPSFAQNHPGSRGLYQEMGSQR